MSESTLADWQIRARAKKQSQLDSIRAEWKIPSALTSNVTRVPYECGLLSSLELEITDTLDVGIILKNLREGVWSSVQVTAAFYKRAVVVHQLVNCLTEIFIERAMARAEEMDRYLKENGKPKGPLHGLPISLKDQFTIKGLETLNGYVSNIGDFATENSVLVEILNELGAVPFVRTNVPQTLMWPETYNHIFGRTLNPYNLDRTPGGSSGGEGALIAMHGSPLGVGTDIGGSIRIPSAMCGTYGLRPSYSRLPYYGARNSMEGQETITSVLGPMSNSISGLKVFTKSILEARPWTRDPMVLRKPWDEEAYALVEHGGRGGRKCFAMLYDNGLVKPHPPIWRAMEMVRKALEDAGHQVIEWENCRHEDIFVNVNKKLFNADGGEDFDRECAKSGEPVIQTMDPKLYSHELHQPGSNAPEETTETLSVYELWQLQKTKRELRKKYLDQWQSTISRTETGRPVDAIISPAAQFAAPPHGQYSSTFYTSLWNGMDYPAGVIPVTFVDAEVDKAVPPHEFYSDDDRENYQMYEPEAFNGLPVGLQVVGQRLEEEAVLGKSIHITSTNLTSQTAMMEEVDSALKQYKTNHSLV